MSTWFFGVPRGRPLPGPRAIARYIWDDSTKYRRVYRLPYDEFGLIELNGTITGFEGWIDTALARRAAREKYQSEILEVKTAPVE